MSNRYMKQFPLAFEGQVKNVFAKVTFNTTGAPVLDTTNSKGVISITRTGTGLYTFAFGGQNPSTPAGSNVPDSYVKLLTISHVFSTEGAGGAMPTAADMAIVDDDTADASDGTMGVVIGRAGTAADPVSGEVGYFQFVFGDSSAY